MRYTDLKGVVVVIIGSNGIVGISQSIYAWMDGRKKMDERKDGMDGWIETWIPCFGFDIYDNNGIEARIIEGNIKSVLSELSLLYLSIVGGPSLQYLFIGRIYIKLYLLFITEI